MLKRVAIIILVLALIGAAVNFPVAMLCAKSRVQTPGAKTRFVLQGADAAKRTWPVRGPHPQPWPELTYYMEAGDFGYLHVQAGHAEGLRGHAFRADREDRRPCTPQ